MQTFQQKHEILKGNYKMKNCKEMNKIEICKT